MSNKLLLGCLSLVMIGALPVIVSAADAPATTQEQPDVKVKLEDCPKPVQDTIKQAVGQGTIKAIEKENEDGKQVYGVDAVIDGKPYEIKVAPDGKLLSKKIDDDHDEKDDKDDNHGKHEHKNK